GSMIADAGFDAVDFSFIDMRDPKSKVYNALMAEDYRQACADALQAVKARGAVFNQAHAPFGGGYDNYLNNLVPLFPRVFECAALLEIPTLVVHPIQRGRFYGHEDEMLQLSIDFYKSLIPLAKEYGVRIGVENMWQMDSRNYIVDDTLAAPEQFCACMDALPAEHFTACLDLGHVELCGREAKDFIRRLGHDRLGALHVHDVDRIRDLHTLPYLGKLNWDDITAALRDVDYTGDFTYEVESFLHPLDDSFIPTALRFMHDVGRHLINKIKQ
ncbi:MAG: sugar phosphate isomerase/epimerase, partial [Clostridia bacterium]|nr:sugar phosphate isomerase/epimerase [Clostridia bacterium]